MNFSDEAKSATQAQLKEMLNDKSFLARAAAMDELSDRLQIAFDEDSLRLLDDAVIEPRNLRTVVRGTITVSHIGMAALARIEHSRAREVFLHLYSIFSEREKIDLMWFLEAEGIKFPLHKFEFA